MLVRDVAYGQIPRGQRAEQHRLAAEWIASLGRPEDHAEMLAHHYGTAIDLRRAAGQQVEPALAEPALASLRDAGDRALSLNAYATATRFYELALRLAATGLSPKTLGCCSSLAAPGSLSGFLSPPNSWRLARSCFSAGTARRQPRRRLFSRRCAGGGATGMRG